MQERFKEYEAFVDHHLRRFLEGHDILEEVKAFALLFQGKPKGEVFRQIVADKGPGKSYVSGKPEGKMKHS